MLFRSLLLPTSLHAMTRDPTKSLQRSLAHLRPPPVRGGKFAMPIPSHFAPKARFVQVKDRIPYWNIAPSDKVIMVRGSKELKGREATVQKVDREGNRIYLTESDFSVRCLCGAWKGRS